MALMSALFTFAASPCAQITFVVVLVGFDVHTRCACYLQL